MPKHEGSFPFFSEVAARSTSKEERAVLHQLLSLGGASPQQLGQLDNLLVVGRCGCGECPTIFFQKHVPGERERDFVSALGRDHEGGIVGAVLLEKDGAPSQMEFYSVDGHEPWAVPESSSLSLMPEVTSGVA